MMMHFATDPMIPYHAGQVWRRGYSLYFTVMTASSGAHMAIVSAPDRSMGTICCADSQGKWEYTTEELKEKFTREGWIYIGRIDEVYSIIPDHPSLVQAEALSDARSIASSLDYDVKAMSGEEREAYHRLRGVARGRAERAEFDAERAKKAEAVAALADAQVEATQPPA